MKNRITVIGAGGHAKVIISLLRLKGLEIDKILDDNPALYGTRLDGSIISGPVDTENIATSGIIAIGNNLARFRVSERLEAVNYGSLQHPTAFVDDSVEIGDGTIVMAGAVVQTGSKIGDHVIINSGAVVEHDCFVDDYCHVGPNATLAGGVAVKSGVFVGAGTTVIEGVSIGTWTKIGAGACVVNHLPAHCTAVGVPAKPIKFQYE